MKSALVALIIMLIGASAFAVDFAASVNMAGDVWGTNGFRLADQNQKDADLLVLSISTDVAGAAGNIYTSNAADGSAALVRNLVVWFKPVPMLKVSIGHIASGLFTEQLNWYMVPLAGIAPDWSGDVIAGKGLALELKPIPELTITAGIAPGFGNTWMTDVDADPLVTKLAVGSNTDFGISAKYKLGTIGSIGAGYRFNGAAFTGADGVYTTDTQSIRLGMDFTMVPGLYAFVTGIARMDKSSNAIDGIAIDNYVSYTTGALSVKAEFPVVIRMDADGVDNVADTADDDAGYLTYDVKVAYKVLDNFSPFFRIGQNGGLTSNYNRAIDFDKDFFFAPKIRVGANYNFGKASLETALQIDLPANDTVAGVTEELPVTWSIPFSCRVSF